MMNQRSPFKIMTFPWPKISLIVLMAFFPLALAAQNPGGQGSPTYIVAFSAVNPSQISTDKGLLDAFNKILPPGVRSHHYITKNLQGTLVGYICIDGEEGKNAVEAALKFSNNLKLLGIVPAEPQHVKTVYGVENLAALIGSEQGVTAPAPDMPPKVVSTIPATGETEVDPALVEITVTFDRDMGGGMSWTGGGPNFPAIPEGKRGNWRDKRTCVLPVQLKPAWIYRVGINAPSFKNFRSAEGIPVEPTAIFFTTLGATQEQKDMVQKPQIASMLPPNGAQNVSPLTRELRVTFSVPMGTGFSWTGGGPQVPTIPEGQKAAWSPDGKTCILPVVLKPNWQYQLGLNGPSYQNFRSKGGVPLEPVAYTFSTGSAN
jgi:hypothetical protein